MVKRNIKCKEVVSVGHGEVLKVFSFLVDVLVIFSNTELTDGDRDSKPKGCSTIYGCVAYFLG